MKATAKDSKELLELLDEHTYLRELNNSNRLMLIQGIELIQNGLQFIEWTDGVLSPNAYDGLTILRNRFDFFKDYVFEGTNINHLAIDRASESIKNVWFGLDGKKNIDKLLKELRTLNVCKFREEYKEQQKELINIAKKELAKEQKTTN